MQQYSVTLEDMLYARERRAGIQSSILQGGCRCLVCLTMNIPGEVKRTPLIRMLFDEGLRRFDGLGLPVSKRLVLDSATGPEAFMAVDVLPEDVKAAAQDIEDAFPAARLFDFDVLTPSGKKLSRPLSRKCLICGAPAAECARSRNHGLDALRAATEGLLRLFAADTLAEAGVDSLMEELYTTPKPGLVDRLNNGAHDDMDIPLFKKSSESLRPYFAQAAMLGMEGCSMAELRLSGLAAERDMFDATGGINTHKGMVYSMGLLLAGMGKALTYGGDAVFHAAAFAREDAETMLNKAARSPVTNGNKAYAVHGARGAIGEAAAGFPNGRFALKRIHYYMELGAPNPSALALCDIMCVLEDTNLLHRGGAEGLAFAKDAAQHISALPIEQREAALVELDAEMIRRNLSPGGCADMLALGFLLLKWKALSEPLDIL